MCVRQVLDLSCNALGDSDMGTLARALQHSKHTTVITDLRLASNTFTHTGLEHVLKVSTPCSLT